MTLTQLGNVLGCSRQNVKKIATVLEKSSLSPLKKSRRCQSYKNLPDLQADAYFKDEFGSYMKELKILFEVYSEEEITPLSSYDENVSRH